MIINTFGYYASVLVVESSWRGYVRNKIATSADELSGNLIIKLPLTLPYPIHTEEYVAASGKIEYNGKPYRMIKKRLYQDTLYVVCMSDPEPGMVNGKIKTYADAMAEAGQDQTTALKSVAPIAKFFLAPPVRLLPVEFGWYRTNTFGEPVNLYRFSLPSVLLRPPAVQAA
jgi:hypothetical protein